MGAVERDSEARAASHQARLQKVVLSWDYIKLLSVTKKSRKRKHKQGGDEDEDGITLRAVPDKFKDLADYLSVFEPLLFEECRAQIIRGEEEGGVPQCHMVALVSWEKANEFYFLRLAVPTDAMETFTENDLLLVSKEKLLGGESLPTTYAFACMEGREGSQTLRVRMYLDGDDSDAIGATATPSKGALRTKAALQGPTSAWWLLKLCNMSTIMREYTALRSVGSLPFMDVILSAEDHRSDILAIKSSTAGLAESIHWNIPALLKECLEGSHNPSQMQAIQAGLSRKPLVLIQGPPGTGKTQTILGLLSVVLHATPARLPSKDGIVQIASRPELSEVEKVKNWIKASPWLGKVNPRDSIMPLDGDDGFFKASRNEFRPETVGPRRKTNAHVLVCAPSNSALDEIVLRLLRTGLRDENGMVYTPSVVRVGLNAHHSVQSVSMDNLVQQRLSSTERSAVTSGPRSGSAGMERDRMRIAILDEAAIVCSTLSFSGAGVFKRMNRGFDVVVIDEAAQAVEPSTMVPLMHGCRQVFLVGDPIQLPATVLSTCAVQHGYGTSLFKRFQQAGYPVQMLRTQYRMHPQIREFPSREFYAEALEDGSDVARQTTRPWHEHRCFGPFAFFDLPGQETQPHGSGSWVNTDEVEFVLVLYRCMVANYPSLKDGPHVAIISPYKQQVKMLRERFKEVLGVEAARLLDINTVDGFQGREKDIAIFSCVRANPEGGIGFVSDFRRMNVGLTRARASMLVVGNSNALQQDKHWSNLIVSALRRMRIFKVTKPYHALFNDQSLLSMKKLDELEKENERAQSEKPVVEMKKPPEVQMQDVETEEYSEDEEFEDVANNGDFDEDLEES